MHSLLYHDVSLGYVPDWAASAHKNKVSDHGEESLKPFFTYVNSSVFLSQWWRPRLGGTQKSSDLPT